MSGAHTARGAAGRRSRWRLGALTGAALAVLAAGCGEDAAPAPVSQDSYQESARAFEAQRADYADEVAECAAERGVELETTWDHGVVVPEGLEGDALSKASEALQACAEEVYPSARRPPEEELEEHYRLLLAAKECLENAGYSPPEPPGLKAFLEAYESEEPPLPWSPYAGVAEDEEGFRAALETCPQPGRY